MKFQLYVSALAVSLITLGAITTSSQSSLAQTGNYFCDTDNGTWTTFARNHNNRKIPVIRWVKTLGEFTPEVRCREVSNRFQKAYSEGILNYLTTGIIKGQSVVCAASQQGGPCEQILFTLKSPKDASSVVQHLTGLGYRARGPINQGDGSPQIYIDMNLLMKGNPASDS